MVPLGITVSWSTLVSSGISMNRERTATMSGSTSDYTRKRSAPPTQDPDPKLPKLHLVFLYCLTLARKQNFDFLALSQRTLRLQK